MTARVPALQHRPTMPKPNDVHHLAIATADIKTQIEFFSDVLGMELLYGGEEAGFSSLRTKDDQSAILNLEEGDTATEWGRMIFHVADVDAFWMYLKERGFEPERPRDASWGER